MAIDTRLADLDFCDGLATAKHGGVFSRGVEGTTCTDSEHSCVQLVPMESGNAAAALIRSRTHNIHVITTRGGKLDRGLEKQNGSPLCQ